MHIFLRIFLRIFLKIFLKIFLRIILNIFSFSPLYVSNQLVVIYLSITLLPIRPKVSRKIVIVGDGACGKTCLLLSGMVYKSSEKI